MFSGGWTTALKKYWDQWASASHCHMSMVEPKNMLNHKPTIYWSYQPLAKWHNPKKIHRLWPIPICSKWQIKFISINTRRNVTSAASREPSSRVSHEGLLGRRLWFSLAMAAPTTMLMAIFFIVQPRSCFWEISILWVCLKLGWLIIIFFIEMVIESWGYPKSPRFSRLKLSNDLDDSRYSKNMGHAHTGLSENAAFENKMVHHRFTN